MQNEAIVISDDEEVRPASLLAVLHFDKLKAYPFERDQITTSAQDQSR
jgi:hypothetical protein